jgi:hypothetical protein
MTSSPPREACETMIALANERGGDDNETVIVADVLGEDLAEVDEYETVTSTFEVLQAFEARPNRQRRRTPVSVPATQPTTKPIEPSAPEQVIEMEASPPPIEVAAPAPERRGWITSLLDRLKIDRPKR